MLINVVEHRIRRRRRKGRPADDTAVPLGQDRAMDTSETVAIPAGPSWLPLALRSVAMPFLRRLGGSRWLARRGTMFGRDLDGLVYRLDLRDEIAQEIWALGGYEAHNRVVLERAAACFPGALLDVGANIGALTVPLARAFPRVLAVEPGPTARGHLEASVAASGLAGVEIAAVGLGEREAVLTFHEAPPDRLGRSGFADAGVGGTPLSLRVTTGDALLAEHGVERVGVVKVDVEGFEEAVLAGLERCLARDRPMVCLEWFPERNAGRMFERLPGYRLFLHAFERSASRARRPFARAAADPARPRLVEATAATLPAGYVSMVFAVPEEAAERFTATLAGPPPAAAGFRR